jgi:hypothetical protein
MKRLNDYINEKQQINEAGLRDTLFGEIVMKLLNTGLDWIQKGASWVANSMKDSVSEAWKSARMLPRSAWTRLSEEHGGYTGPVPTNDKEFNKFIEWCLAPKDIKERVNRAKLFYSSFEGTKQDQVDNIYVNLIIMAVTPVMNDDKASKSDKEFANKILKETKSKFGQTFDKAFEPWEKEYEEWKKKNGGDKK